MNKRIWSVLGATATAVLVSGCASPPRAEKAAKLPLGSTWTVQVRTTGSYSGAPAELQSKTVEVMWNGQPHRGFTSGPNTIVQAPAGDWIAQLGPDGKPLLTWDPPVGFNWPLEVGKTWTRSFKFTNHATKQALDITANATVEAYEDVTVQAGTFKAFRVRITNNVGLEETFWYNPEHDVFVKYFVRRSDKSALGPGTRETELKAIAVAR